MPSLSTTSLTKESLSLVDSAKTKLLFEQPRNRWMKAEPIRVPIGKATKGRRLDFGKTDRSVRANFVDLLPNRYERTTFTADQKASLEAVFRTNKYPSRQEKLTLAMKLEISGAKIQIWFSNRRQKWRRQQKRRAATPPRPRPVLPAAPKVNTSCKRSFKSTVSDTRFPQFPAELQVPSQPLTSSQLQATAPFVPASHHVTESFSAYSAGTQLYPQQPYPVPRPPASVDTAPLPYQPVYPSFTAPLRRIQQQQPQATYRVQPTPVPSYPAHHSLNPVNPVEPDFYQSSVAESRRLTDEFPFSYSIAKELPHIFGNLEEDEILDRPLTPTFEPPAEYEPLWDLMAQDLTPYHGNPAILSNEHLTVRDFDSSNFSSCCYGSGEMSALQPLRELSCGFISKGRSFKSCRQD